MPVQLPNLPDISSGRPASNDYFLVRDTSANADRRVSWENMHQTNVFTPTVTFAVPGDLAVAYTTQEGVFCRLGRLVSFRVRVVFTPTFTTASGSFSIPVTGIQIGALGNGYIAGQLRHSAGFTYPAGRTTVYCRCNTASLFLTAIGSGVSETNITTSAFTSGVNVDLAMSGSYLATGF